jgi:hypothetical protein
MLSHSMLKRVLLLCTIILCVTLYLHVAQQQTTEVNTCLTCIDQSAYMAFARQARDSHYAYSSDGARAPLYPFLQSLFLRPEMSDEEFFQQGKLVNIALSLVLLAVLALVVRRYLAPLHALVFVLIAAFSVIIFKAAWFQAEVLYYFLTFFTYLLFWRLLRSPRIWLAIVAGIVAGVTHLAKAAVFPSLAVFAVFALANWLWTRLETGRPAQAAPSGRALTSAILVIPLVAVFFLATVFPVERENKRIFGRYFYNVNSTFYVWYDSWEQAKAGTRAHGDRVGWPQMPAGELPSLSKYLREHTPAQMLDRVVAGALRIWLEAADAPSYLRYLLVFAGLFLAAAAWQRARLCQIMTRYPLVCLFPVAYFALNFLLAFWQEPIVRGNRLVLAQFLPLMFTLAVGIQALLGSTTLRIGRPIGVLQLIDALILAMLAADIYLVVTGPAGNYYGGA